MHELSANKRFHQRIKQGDPPQQMGLCGSVGDVARLNGRYRLAREFKEGVFQNYSPRTAANYSALIRVHLTYSALEVFEKVVNESIPSLTSLPTLNAAIKRATGSLKQIDPKHRILQVVIRKLDDPGLVENLQKDIDKDKVDLARAISSIRHVFVHGSMVANPADLSRVDIHEYCRVLSDFWLDAINSEFSRRVP